MKTVSKSRWNVHDLNQAVKVLKEGGIILYPTDTIWGIGCDATQADAVEKIYRIKERPVGKSMLVLVSDIHMAEGYTEDTPELILQVMKEALDPLTLIFPKACKLASNLPAADGSIGMRLPRDPFCVELIKKLGRPIVSSSANRSSEPPPPLFIDIPQYFLNLVDYVVQWRQDDLRPGKPSTVVMLNAEGEMEMIRP
ncbi:MAG: threonylcarbamoyl-AMP synthase [Bacteroidetes bacterium GWF2_49_14]|nr:MAG: threonylcarbamoyl-AMP synthase [Bacteroidetes bacterium GWF2_49_14]